MGPRRLRGGRWAAPRHRTPPRPRARWPPRRPYRCPSRRARLSVYSIPDAGYTAASMLLAAVTLLDIVRLLVLLIVVNAVLLSPAIAAIIGAFSERLANRDHRPQV